MLQENEVFLRRLRHLYLCAFWVLLVKSPAVIQGGKGAGLHGQHQIESAQKYEYAAITVKTSVFTQETHVYYT